MVKRRGQPNVKAIECQQHAGVVPNDGTDKCHDHALNGISDDVQVGRLDVYISGRKGREEVRFAMAVVVYAFVFASVLSMTVEERRARS